MLTEHEVGGDVARRPRGEESRSGGTQIIEQVSEMLSLDSIEGRAGHVDHCD